MLTSGIVGLPMSGKTTLFNLLTNTEPSENNRAPVTAMATVPDPRVDKLSALYQPKKTTYGQIQLTDVAGLSEGAGKSAAFLDAIRMSQALVHVVRGFSGDFPHPLGSIDLVRDFNIVNNELLLADMALVEKRLEKIKTSGKIKGPQKEQLPVLEKCLEHLMEEKPMTALALSEAERETLQGLIFFTDKPQLVVVNLDDADLGKDLPGIVELTQLVEEQGWQILTLSAQIEVEIAQLSAEEQATFMEDLGINEPGTALVARQAYKLLGLITFFTVGKDEVRAWELRQGRTAVDAAGTIHSDLARGFIRADVMKTTDLLKLGSEAAVKEKGLSQLVGKDYIVEDGDIVHIRFNV
ncbi:MAG: redox-regulated ATPase YchF [Firmicutes bacterium]|nr:redox-regulated ATPase YchF [Bacillota bacterium]